MKVIVVGLSEHAALLLGVKDPSKESNLKDLDPKEAAKVLDNEPLLSSETTHKPEARDQKVIALIAPDNRNSTFVAIELASFTAGVEFMSAMSDVLSRPRKPNFVRKDGLTLGLDIQN